jgi:hypothetical protein
MKIFRYKFLKSNELAIVPERGYEKIDKSSDKAIKYMEWISNVEGIKIQHAGNGREKSFQGVDPISNKHWKMKVDGYDEKKDRAIEFLGWWEIFIEILTLM